MRTPDYRDTEREARDRIAAEALELWAKPDKGQTMITLSESKVMALIELYAGFIYTPVSGFEDIRNATSKLSEQVCGALGAQKAKDEMAAERRAQAKGRRAGGR